MAHGVVAVGLRYIFKRCGVLGVLQASVLYSPQVRWAAVVDRFYELLSQYSTEPPRDAATRENVEVCAVANVDQDSPLCFYLDSVDLKSFKT